MKPGDAVQMDTDVAVSAMKALIAEERGNGCPMADDLFIDPALRRWNSFDRRSKRQRHQSLTHRTQDLEKGLIEWYIQHHGYGYDPACIRHLAQSFAAILNDHNK